MMISVLVLGYLGRQCSGYTVGNQGWGFRLQRPLDLIDGKGGHPGGQIKEPQLTPCG